MSSSTSRWRALAGVVAVALTLAACGSDEKPAASSGAAKTGDKPSIPAKTLGVLDSGGGSGAQLRCKTALEAAAKEVGWKLDYVDSMRDPAKALQIVQNFITQQVDGIVSLGVPQQWAAVAYKQARAKGIPVVTTCGDVGPPNTTFDGVYAEDETKVGVAISKQLVDDVTKEGGGEVAIVSGSWHPAGAHRAQALADAVKGTDVKIVGKPDLDPKSVLPSAQKITTDLITAHPDLKAIYVVFDGPLPTVDKAIKATGKDIKLYGYYAHEANLPLLRDPADPLQAVAEAPLAQTAFVAVDQLLRKLVKNEPIEMDAFKAVADDPSAYYAITKTDAPAKPNGTDDVQLIKLDELAKPFFDRWRSEYGS